MLQAIGLTPAEQQVYERLVRGPAMTPAELDVSLGQDGASAGIGQVLARLRELGLVSRLPGEPARWSATAPGTTLEMLIRERSRALAEAARRVAELGSRFDEATAQQDAPKAIEVVYGREAVIRSGMELQRAARYQIRSCDAPPYPAGNPATLNRLEVEQLRRGIRYRILYDPSGLDVPGRLTDLEAGLAVGEEARVTDVPLKMSLIDDTAAILPLRHPVDVESRVIVHDPVLVGALSALFEMHWERALPLRPGSGPADGPSPAEARLLPLLLAGLTDREAAAQLNLSDRTVRSRVQSMMNRLDAATRFQAGFQAVSRGWLTVDSQPAAASNSDVDRTSGAEPTW